MALLTCSFIDKVSIFTLLSDKPHNRIGLVWRSFVVDQAAYCILHVYFPFRKFSFCSFSFLFFCEES